MVIFRNFCSKNCQFSVNFQDNSRDRNRKSRKKKNSFFSAYCASFMRVGSKLRGGLHILSQDRAKYSSYHIYVQLIPQFFQMYIFFSNFLYFSCIFLLTCIYILFTILQTRVFMFNFMRKCSADTNPNTRYREIHTTASRRIVYRSTPSTIVRELHLKFCPEKNRLPLAY